MAKKKWGRDFRAGDIVGTTFEIWLKYLIPFGLLSLVVMAPLFVVQFLGILPEGNAGVAVENLLSLFLGQLLTATLVYAVFRHLSGDKVRMGDCVARGFSVLLPVLGIAILTGIIVALGLVALIVPGVILYCVLWVAVPAGAVERLGVGEALKRSAELTRDYRGAIFLVLLIMFLLQLLLGGVLGFAMGLATAAAGSGMFLVLGVLLAILLAPLGAIPPAVGYYQLRLTKEGLDADELASVFD